MPKARTEVIESNKWNLTRFFGDIDEFNKLFDEVKQLIPKLKQYEKTLNIKNVKECLDLYSLISRKTERLFVYAYAKHDEDTANTEYQALKQKIEMLYVEISSASSFITPTLATFTSASLRRLSKDEKYTNYSLMFTEIIREKKHILAKSHEKILSEISSFSGDFQHIFSMIDNADLKFKSITDNKGKSVELSHGTYSLMLQNPEQKIRKKAFEAYYDSFIGMINTIGMTYQASVKKDCAMSKIRGYKDALSSALYSEGISTKVYNNLIKSVKATTPLVHTYIGLRKKALKLNELHMYDLYVPIAKKAKLELSFDEAYDLVIEALQPLGDDYVNLVKRAREERWIDVEETKNKRSGAYSISCYETEPLVLLNYQKTAHDVFTIAHELGHAIHSYLSNKNQCYEKAGYSIFLAEIASTVNEMLLWKHLMSKKPKPDTKRFLLSYFIDMLRTTIYRQTMFAEFERFTHEQIENSIPLTYEAMNNKYYELNKEYYGKEVVHDPQIAYEWCRIPHFYRAFYVYKYATGLTAAINIVHKILNKENYVPNYLKFLSLGGSVLPLDALEVAEVNLTKIMPFNIVRNEFESALRKLKRLTK